MRLSHPERRTPTIRQFVLVLAAVTVFALAMPVGVRAAGQLVTLVDPSTTSKARVVGGSLRVAEFNDPARLPFTTTRSLPMSAATTGVAELLITVPAGRRLVIDTVGFSASLPQGQRAITDRVSVASGGSSAGFSIPLSFSGTSSGLDRFVGLEHVQLYADPGSNVLVSWTRNSATGAATGTFSISGHFVKL